jgi:nicotinamidase/pyrazinamidase
VKTVFFDVDTQIDFVFPAGALYAPGAASIVRTVAELNRYAGANGIPVISTMDAHSENDPEFHDWPAHCVVGTVGQQKPAATLLEKRIVIPNRDTAERVDTSSQILLEKVHLDCFTNPNLDWILEALNAEHYVVYGVVTEICVSFAAFGLLNTGKRVEIVTDAARALSREAGNETLERFRREGGGLATADAVLGGADFSLRRPSDRDLRG